MRFPWQKKPLTLIEVFDEYKQNNMRIRTEKARGCYRRSIARLTEVVGHEATVDDLTDENISKLMNLLLHEGKTASTASYYGKSIKAIWWFATARGYACSRSNGTKLPEVSQPLREGGAL